MASYKGPEKPTSKMTPLWFSRRGVVVVVVVGIRVSFEKSELVYDYGRRLSVATRVGRLNGTEHEYFGCSTIRTFLQSLPRWAEHKHTEKIVQEKDPYPSQYT